MKFVWLRWFFPIYGICLIRVIDAETRRYVHLYSVQENIKKARRTIHSLMGAGLHGENGLDPDT
ncbi:MAG: hypothetical protein AB2693_27040, partial [Candidatus Thiodiazotropha sp.]